MAGYKERLRVALSAAAKRESVTEIAQAIGLPGPQPLYDFLSRGVLGKQKCSGVENWLKEHNYLPDEAPEQENVRAEPLSDPFDVVRLDLKALIATIESDRFSEAEKVQRLSAFVSFYAPLLDRFAGTGKTGEE